MVLKFFVFCGFSSLSCCWSSRRSGRALYPFELHWCVTRCFCLDCLLCHNLSALWVCINVSFDALWIHIYISYLLLVLLSLKNMSFWLLVAKYAPSNTLLAQQWVPSDSALDDVRCSECLAERITFEQIQSVLAFWWTTIEESSCCVIFVTQENPGLGWCAIA